MDIVTLSLCKKSAKAYTDSVFEGIGRGILYRGAVNYYSDLPNDASIGDCYSVLYQGTSGTTPSGLEYVWGVISGESSASWIQLGTSGNGSESIANKVTTLDANSTDIQYPSAKCVYDLIGNVETLLTELDTGSGVE